MAIINQKFGINWASYNADCVFGMRELPAKSVKFIPYSPPFLALYIYSDSIADLGNTDSEEQFFEGWRFHLEEQYRILQDDGHIAVHCKDTMRYMSSHKYAGLFDFPGHIIRLCEEVGFTFERWITIWKDPVIEMQRTKTYGLLHKSFCERGEVTRQGCADFVLIFNKNGQQKANDKLPSINQQVIERCVQQWTNEGENIYTPFGKNIRGRKISAVNLAYSFYPSINGLSQQFMKDLLTRTQVGRLTTIQCPPSQLSHIVQDFENVDGWKFHSRCALTDGSYLVTFRNWSSHPDNNIVKHNITPPDVDYQYVEVPKIENGAQNWEISWKQAIADGTEDHPDYVGTQPPIGWRDRGYYSILLWQRYASPVWFDLEELPESHPDSWMNIIQTNVLNYRQAKGEEEEKHICPLQLDLIDLLLDEYSDPGDVILTPYGGIGSEGYQAIKKERKAILFELKPEYWGIGCKNLTAAELEITQKAIML